MAANYLSPAEEWTENGNSKCTKYWFRSVKRRWANNTVDFNAIALGLCVWILYFCFLHWDSEFGDDFIRRRMKILMNALAFHAKVKQQQ